MMTNEAGPYGMTTYLMVNRTIVTTVSKMLAGGKHKR
jgi:hypothetical protein